MSFNLTTITSLANHRRHTNDNSDNNNDEDVPDVSDTERLWVIIGFVLILIALQVIGFVMCCKDRWLAKRKAVKTEENRQSQAIEISETLTSIRQPKESRAVVDDDTNKDLEAGKALLNPKEQENQNDPKASAVGEPSVVQVHRDNEDSEQGESNKA